MQFKFEMAGAWLWPLFICIYIYIYYVCVFTLAKMLSKYN